MRDSCEGYRQKAMEILKKSYGNRKIDPRIAGEVWNRLVQQTFICFRELLADLLATRMLGFSFFVSQAEFLKTLTGWSQPAILESGYPGIKFRLSVVFNHLIENEYPENVLSFLKSSSKAHNRITRPLISYIDAWRQQLEGLPELYTIKEPDNTQDIPQQLTTLAENVVRQTLSGLTQVARKVIPDNKCARLTTQFFERIERLELELPPSCSHEPEDCFAEIMSASWAYQLIHGEEREAKREVFEKKFDEYSKTCRLILKAIELIPASQENHSHIEPKQTVKIKTIKKNLASARGVLSAPHILWRTQLPPQDPSHLAVIPLNLDAIKQASLDVHLGNWFAFARRTKLKGVQIGIESEEKLLMTIGREEVFVPSGKTFLLHPGDLVLGATLEFIALPADTMAFVEGRSGLGRLGLIVATATQVAPGFHGVVVLELANTGTVPLALTPGSPIAQLVLQVMTAPVPDDQVYRGKYHCQIKP
jgi:deoxycytidine triphosphate deaminase